MPNVVRFTLPTARDFEVPGAGAFHAGVLDVDVNDLKLLTKTRFLVQPYGAVEVGVVDSATPPPTLPAVPGPPNPDPYPQYPTMDEIIASPELRAAFGPQVYSNVLPYAPGEIHGQTTSAKALIVIGMTGTGRIWARDATGGNLSQSDDWGVTWKHGCGLPTNTSSANLVKIVQFGGYFYTTLLDTVTSLWGVYRTPAVAQGATYTWSAQLFTMPTGVTNQIRTCLTADAQNLYLGGYTTGATVESRVWKSANGTTWTVAYDVNTVGAGWRHIHALAVDPYNAGHVYVAVGDNGSPVCIARSTDYGATWETVISGAPDNPWQSVQISFSEQWVWVASDRVGFDALVFDRDEKIPYVAHQGWHYNMPVVPAAVVTDRFYQIGYWGAVDPASGVFHFVSADTSTPGNTKGYFRIPHLGAPVELVEALPTSETAGEVWIGNGYVWIGSRRWKLAATERVPAP